MRQFAIGFLVCLGTILTLGLVRCGGYPEVVREPCPVRDAAAEQSPQLLVVVVHGEDFDPNSLGFQDCSGDLCDAGAD